MEYGILKKAARNNETVTGVSRYSVGSLIECFLFLQILAVQISK